MYRLFTKQILELCNRNYVVIKQPLNMRRSKSLIKLLKFNFKTIIGNLIFLLNIVQIIK